MAEQVEYLVHELRQQVAIRHEHHVRCIAGDSRQLLLDNFARFSSLTHRNIIGTQVAVQTGHPDAHDLQQLVQLAQLIRDRYRIVADVVAEFDVDQQMIKLTIRR